MLFQQLVDVSVQLVFVFLFVVQVQFFESLDVLGKGGDAFCLNLLPWELLPSALRA